MHAWTLLLISKKGKETIPRRILALVINLKEVSSPLDPNRNQVISHKINNLLVNKDPIF
jgi:hypothetical protein